MSAEEVVSPVAEWYNGRTVFITGGSGFMGKVLIEKLLYACTKIKCIYVLMRNKRGKTPVQRIADMWQLPVSFVTNLIVIFYASNKYHTLFELDC